MVQIKHKKVTGRPVSIADWDDAHVLVGTPGTVLGFGEDGTAVELDAGVGGTVDLTNYYTKAQVDAAIAAAIAGTPPDVTLAALSLSSSSFTVGTATSGTINGATNGSTITLSNAPTGFTINSGARTWAYSGAGAASSGNLTLTEALAGATNTPRASVIGYTVTAAPVEETPVPSFTWTSSTAERSNLAFDVTTELLEDDVVTLYIREGTANGTLFHSEPKTVSGAEALNGELTFPGVPELDYGVTYFITMTLTRNGVVSAPSAAQSKTMDIEVITPTTWGAKSSFITLSNGDLTATGTGDVGAEQPVIGSASKTGKRYFEVHYASPRSEFGKMGVGLANTLPADFTDPGDSADIVLFKANSALRHNSADLAYLTSWEGSTAATTIGIAYDTATKTVWVRLNGSWLNGDPGAGSGGHVAAGLTAYRPIATANYAEVITLRRKASEFTGSVPTGFLGLDD